MTIFSKKIPIGRLVPEVAARKNAFVIPPLRSEPEGLRIGREMVPWVCRPDAELLELRDLMSQAKRKCPGSWAARANRAPRV